MVETTQNNQNSANEASGGQVDKETLWYLNNYLLLKDYLDRTISRIAARCVRMGNIAIEEYPFYPYILDVLEEISQTGNFILEHQELYPYVEKKIVGGMAAFKKNLAEYEQELSNNSSPDMVKQDEDEVDKARKLLSGEGTDDPTQNAGMSMDEVVEKIMKENKQAEDASEDENAEIDTTQAPAQEEPLETK